MSSNLPIKGEIYVAPAFAANRACPGEKTSVQFVFIPSDAKYLIALIPSFIMGIFTTICPLMAANDLASFTICS